MRTKALRSPTDIIFSEEKKGLKITGKNDVRILADSDVYSL